MARLLACSLVVLAAGCCRRSGDTPEPVGRAASQHADPLFTGAVDEATFASLHEHTDAAAPRRFGETVRAGAAVFYRSLPTRTGPHPGVVVIHEWWGLNAHIEHWADRLAALGYAALAVDLYGGRTATTPEGAMELVGSVDEDEARATLAAAVAYLEANGSERIAVLGWCFGGGWALRAGVEVAGIDATIMYYGRPITEAAALEGYGGPLLGVFGNEDTSIPPATVDAFAAALTEAGVDHALRRYDASHAFANPSSARYDPVAAEAAWGEVQAFLRTHLAP
ncbi:MAG: dienelactone hydrolase family protein [Myxococcota bacterium]